MNITKMLEKLDEITEQRKQINHFASGESVSLYQLREILEAGREPTDTSLEDGVSRLERINTEFRSLRGKIEALERRVAQLECRTAHQVVLGKDTWRGAKKDATAVSTCEHQWTARLLRVAGDEGYGWRESVVEKYCSKCGMGKPEAKAVDNTPPDGMIGHDCKKCKDKDAYCPDCQGEIYDKHFKPQPTTPLAEEKQLPKGVHCGVAHCPVHGWECPKDFKCVAEEQVLPCPFCGYMPVCLKLNEKKSPQMYRYGCIHGMCANLRRWFDTKEEALRYWNRRSHNPLPKDKILVDRKDIEDYLVHYEKQMEGREYLLVTKLRKALGAERGERV